MTRPPLHERSRSRRGSARRPGPGRTVAGLAAAVAAAALLTGCSTGDDIVAGAQPAAEPEIVPLAVPTFDPEEVAAAHAGAAFVDAGSGVLLPDPGRTPGATFPDVTEADVCEVHYTMGVRQPRFNDKVAAFDGYGLSIREREAYQVDHLVPVSLGGTNATQNLWPQPRGGERGAASKDELERQLRGLVCAGTVPLAEAQQAIARDWSAAYDKYMPVPVPDSALPPSYGAGSDPAEPADPFAVTNGGPCPTEGAVGRTESKGIKFTCQRWDDGQLHWGKRY